MKTRHIFLSLTLLIIGVSSSFAQDTLLISPAKIDSLHQLIDSRPKADEEKVRLLNEYARLCFYNEEYLNGFSAARNAHELSKNLNPTCSINHSLKKTSFFIVLIISNI